MAKDIIFKTFRTKLNGYVYDRHTHSVFALPDAEFEELQRVERGELLPEDSIVIAMLQEQGVLQKNVVTEIKHPSTDYLSHYIAHRLGQLILQVTQQCNLRCGYCCYGGGYTHMRVHANQWMEWETAKRAIDFYLERTDERDTLTISFYGGEPLLAFPLIKQCVSYITEHVEGKEIHFSMTTNGTLLTPEVVDYLYEHHFHLSISLDGTKEDHDVNRKFRSGQGSFDTIMNHIREIKEAHPDFMKDIAIMTTINPKMDLGCAMDYFEANEYLADSRFVYNSVATKGAKETINYDEPSKLLRRYEYLKLLLAHANMLDIECTSALMQSTRAHRMQVYQGLYQHTPLPSVISHGGPCVPGNKRLFVSVDGAFFPCEKVSETSEYFCIGSLDEGIDEEKAARLLNCGQITADECKECWNLRGCMMCMNQVDFEGMPCKADKCKVCADEKFRELSDLREICVLHEFGYDLPQEGDDRT
ncbi:Cys-rich peptide radical SAM maturase CcpM [Zongyangia hominis]|uniref:Cys-rich peptide radical SAM maturase CcpM n=1 Tax=Zongyangia hominis TaxID=2763677 RepID=A0A926E8K1_9FIRM|nr:Cys-rich peptide radical SAM maturase CcpM [Zongyangia hominis]MBC8569870.1 Cys-rich peptide radical SAM maturase CcpM [Zongyangia hominis]